MATNNSANIKTQGVCYCNGSGVFSGVDGSTSGYVLTSNGTGVAPSFQAAGGGGILSATVVLTSAQVKALRATPQTIVAAQGAGTFIAIVSASSKMTYAGTNVFTNGQVRELLYNGVTQITTGCTTAAQINSSQNYYAAAAISQASNNSTFTENVGVLIKNTGASEITGNAAGDNTLTISVLYRVLTI